MPKSKKKDTSQFPAMVQDGDVATVDESPLDLYGKIEKIKAAAKAIADDPECHNDRGVLTDAARNQLKGMIADVALLLTLGFATEGERGEQRGVLHELASLLKGPLGDITAGGADEEISVEFKNQEKWSKEEG